MSQNIWLKSVEICQDAKYSILLNPPPPSSLPILASALFLAVWTGSNFRQSTHSLLTSNVYLCIEASCKILIKFTYVQYTELVHSLYCSGKIKMFICNTRLVDSFKIIILFSKIYNIFVEFCKSLHSCTSMTGKI